MKPRIRIWGTAPTQLGSVSPAVRLQAAARTQRVQQPVPYREWGTVSHLKK